jgi:hypothetical protein
MNNKNIIVERRAAGSRLLVIGFAAAVVLVLGAVSTSSAQEQGEIPQADLRVELVGLVDQLLESEHPLIDEVAIETLWEVRLRLETISDAELAEFEALTPQIVQMKSAFEAVTNVERHRTLRARERQLDLDLANSMGGKRSFLKSSGFPEAVYPNLVGEIGATVDVLAGSFLDTGWLTKPGIPGQSSVTSFGECDAIDRSTTPEAYGTRIAFIVLEAARDVADRICAQSIGLLVAGGNASILCIPMDFAYIVGKSLHDNLAMCDGFIDAAEIEGTYERLGHIHGDLDAATFGGVSGHSSLVELDTELAAHVTALATHHTKISDKIAANQTALTNAIGEAGTAVLGATATHDASIKAMLASSSAFFKRLEIEEALLNQEREAVYYLPAAHGGHLELARNIVEETIANVIASGESVFNADDLLNEADVHMGAGNYKMAFNYLGAAYFEAIKKDRRENMPSPNSIP